MKALAVLVGASLLGVLALGAMRLFHLAGGDVQWLKAIPWVVYLVALCFLGGIFFLILRNISHHRQGERPQQGESPPM
jgi:TRAP-type C4-dicarboxylate transport system permease small subunit